MEKLKIIFVFMISGLIFSCQKSPISTKPEILTAHYEIKTHSEFERGYEISIVINQISESVTVKGIVFKNRYFEKVHLTKIKDNKISIEQYFPIQSKMIHDFTPPNTDSRADGIIFEINGQEQFYKVKFKLK